MKPYLLIALLLLLFVTGVYAQAPREVRGTVTDSTKLSIPGASIKLTSEADSANAAADVNGKFVFPLVKGNKLTLTFTSIGFQTLIKHYTVEADGKPVDLGAIVMPVQSNLLNQVNIVGQVVPIQVKEDTVEYKVSAYGVRANAPIEDAIKKMPGIDVDKDGNVTAQGKSVTRVRVNGKDFFGGDLQTATKNLPADVVESIQIVDDYGDQANLTGVKTGESTKILNINIRKDKNYGYSLQATGGTGYDLLPKNDGVSNESRYVGELNALKFKGDQQIAVIGKLNNTNVNTFSFSAPTGGGFGGNFSGGGGGGGGGGRGNALRGGGGSTGQATAANGITDAKSIGLNFADVYGKKLTVYGSYSFSDNSTFTNSSSIQINRFTNPSTSTSLSTQTRNPLNHRFNLSLEYRPDTMNYIKIVPTFNYSRTNQGGFDSVLSVRQNVTNLGYTVASQTNTESPSFSINGLYNHRFNARGRNFSFNVNFSTAKNDQFDNPIYHYTFGEATTPLNQRINTDSRTNTWSTNLSYMEPLSKLSFLELNYAYSHSYTTSDKRTDTLSYTGSTPPDTYTDADFTRYALLSNSYNYTFTTNRVGLNYRFVEKKYNYTLGIAVQPATLKGQSVNAAELTRNSFNIIPVARLTYNFARSESLNFNYNGQSNQPSFNQLQPVLDLSNSLYPVQGNPNLKADFTNNVSLGYNKFSIETGNVFFTRLQFTQIDNQVVSQTTTYPVKFANALQGIPGLKNLQNTNLTTYRNADGYYRAEAFAVYSKPWAQRKYTLFLNGRVSYNNNVGYSNFVDSLNNASAFEKNISKNLVFTPGTRFRVNITDIVDAEVNAAYSINRTVSNVGNNPLFNQNTNVRTLTLGINGKNYFWKNWTFSYDFSRAINYGYSVPVSNPNILNVYVERRFLKDNRATIRAQAFDLFNQQRGFTSADNGNITTQTNVNRLSRYFLLTFSLRLQKFAGKAPTQQQGEGRDFRRGNGGGQGGPPPGGGGPGAM